MTSSVLERYRSGTPCVEPVDPADLVCPGCFEPAVGEPPSEWPTGAGRRPEFSHPDGSVLCPDSAGRIGEPVEAGEQRFWLTPAAEQALGARTAVR